MSERIHFGALKMQDRDQIASNRSANSGSSRAATLGESAQRNIAQREAVLHQIEQERSARSIAVPTNDSHVKLRLRELGQPICLFAEGRGLGRLCKSFFDLSASFRCSFLAYIISFTS